ncbi:MAG: YXWGXW repeat-containing protein [Acidobacteriota bacterium]|nr:YXWGXW repeat-containing protein [Acidobacteriota bacterium]
MRNKLLALVLMGVGTVLSGQVNVGVQIGPPPPPRAYRQRPRPGPDFEWIEGYWHPRGHRYAWHDGYWTRIPYGAHAGWVRAMSGAHFTRATGKAAGDVWTITIAGIATGTGIATVGATGISVETGMTGGIATIAAD